MQQKLLLQIAGTLTLPFDVVKTHKQIELGEVDFAVKGQGQIFFPHFYVHEMERFS